MSNFDPFGGVDMVIASGGNVQLLKALRATQQQIQLINGGPVNASLDGNNPQTTAAPVLSPFTVVGNQGKFVIDIVAPQAIVYLSQAQKRAAK